MILKPSMSAFCCVILGIINFSWSISANYISFICAFDNYMYKLIISFYFLLSNSEFSSFFSKFLIIMPIDLMPSYFTFKFLLKQSVIKKAVIKFH